MSSTSSSIRGSGPPDVDAGRARDTATPRRRPQLDAPAAQQPAVDVRADPAHRRRALGALRAADRTQQPVRDRRSAGTAAVQPLPVRDDRSGLRRVRPGDLGRANLARDRRVRGRDLDLPRGVLRPARRLQRRLDRRRDQPLHQRLPRHSRIAAADRPADVRTLPRSDGDDPHPRLDDVGARGPRSPQPGALAAEPRLRARGEGRGGVDAPDGLRRGDAEHDQPDCGGLPLRLLPVDPLRGGSRVPRLRRREQDDLGRDDVLGAEQLGGAPGRVVALLLPGPRARDHHGRPGVHQLRHRRALEPAPAAAAAAAPPAERLGVTLVVETLPVTVTQEQSTLVELRELVVDYVGSERQVRAVDHVNLSIAPGEIVGLAGESGCGKSTVAHALMQILRYPAQLTEGSILFGGRDLAMLSDAELRRFRWRNVSLVFQSAMNALNPVLRVGDQFVDMMRAHEPVRKRDALERAADLLEVVGIERSSVRAYAPELSGGMRQRVIIAMALALQRELGFAVLFITHDLSLLLEFANRIAIMYAGELVEVAPAEALFRSARHPYTVGLMSSFPPLTGPLERMTGIPGSPPDLARPPAGCRFHPRCPHCIPGEALYERQTTVKPELREVAPGHLVACHLVEAQA